MWKPISKDTLCNSSVSHSYAAAPQPGRFHQQFQGKQGIWLATQC
jgi:hypothetical protein